MDVLVTVTFSTSRGLTSDADIAIVADCISYLQVVWILSVREDMGRECLTLRDLNH